MWVHPFAGVRTPVHFKAEREIGSWGEFELLPSIFTELSRFLEAHAGGHIQQGWVPSSVVILTWFEVNRTTVRYLFDKLINQFIANLFFFNRNHLLKKIFWGLSRRSSD